MFKVLLKHSIVFFNKQAIVIGPTPPGTGVKAFATFETSSKSTSPTRPFFVLTRLYRNALTIKKVKFLVCGVFEMYKVHSLHTYKKCVL